MWEQGPISGKDLWGKDVPQTSGKDLWAKLFQNLSGIVPKYPNLLPDWSRLESKIIKKQ